MITGIWKHFHKNKTPDKVTEQMKDSTTEQTTTEAAAPYINENFLAKELPADRNAALAILKEQGETDSDIKNIYENAAAYPDKSFRALQLIQK